MEHAMSKAQKRTQATEIERSRRKTADAMRAFAESYNRSRSPHEALLRIIAACETIVKNTVSPLNDEIRSYYRPDIVVHAMLAILAARRAIEANKAEDALGASADSMEAVFEFEAVRKIAQDRIWLRGYWVEGLSTADRRLVAIFQDCDIRPAGEAYDAHTNTNPRPKTWKPTLRKQLSRINKSLPDGMKLKSVKGEHVKLLKV